MDREPPPWAGDVFRKQNLGNAPPAVLLQQAYRLHALQSAIHEENIQTVFRLLRRFVD